MPSSPTSEEFLVRWQNSGAAERANYQLFLSELCDFLELPRPEPTQPDESLNNYTFEKSVQFRDLFAQSTGRIDLYKRGCFVLEAKQGSQALSSAHLAAPTGPRRRGTAIRDTPLWDLAMLKARGQAEQYAKALPLSHGWPPFILVVDVGHTIELYADFSLTGKAYLPFPDPRSFRIALPELTQPEIRNRLRAVWLDPLSLDPSRHTARVTREVAAKLAGLAHTLELDHPPKLVAEFLTRCIFTCFAEDVGLLPERGWLNLLQSLRGDERNFPPMAEALWTTMNEGGFSPSCATPSSSSTVASFNPSTLCPSARDSSTC